MMIAAFILVLYVESEGVVRSVDTFPMKDKVTCERVAARMVKDKINITFRCLRNG
jgi:hypothetical protein